MLIVSITNSSKYRQLLQSSTVDHRICSPLKLWQTLVFRFSSKQESTNYTRSRANNACARQYGFIIV